MTLLTRESPRTRKIGMKVHKDQPYRKKRAKTKKARRSRNQKPKRSNQLFLLRFTLMTRIELITHKVLEIKRTSSSRTPQKRSSNPKLSTTWNLKKKIITKISTSTTYLTKRFSSKISATTRPKERNESKPTSSTTPNSDYQSTVGTPVDTPIKLSKPRYQLAQFRIEYPKEVLATLHSDPEGSINSFVTNLEDTDVMKEVIKIPPRPSEAEKAAGEGDTGNDTTNNSDKSSIGSDGSQVNRTTQEITNVEKRPKSSQQKASSDREFKTPTPKLWKRSSRIVLADYNTRDR
ncbi:hypothetical protein JTB14_020029 [Gonioctena quinquepunctata]|nr:hypothetical protein JTB14_020029 [Gonioctena quinquepunctata]